LTPIGDRFEHSPDVLRVAPDPPPSSRISKTAKKAEPFIPGSDISDAIAKSNPKELAKALKKLKNAPLEVKKNVEKMVDKMAKAEGITDDDGGGDDDGAVTTTAAPSPKTTTTRPSEKNIKGKEVIITTVAPKNNARKQNSKNSKSSASSSKDKSKEAKKKEAEASKQAKPANAVTTAAKKETKEKKKQNQEIQKVLAKQEAVPEEKTGIKKAGIQDEKKGEKTDGKEKAKVKEKAKTKGEAPPEMQEKLVACPNPDKDIPTEIFWGQEVMLSLTGTCYKRYELRMPPYERAPFNLHFNLYTRDKVGRGCNGIVMRLRKNCGDVSANPQACVTPPEGFVKPFIDTKEVREVRMNGGTAMLDAYEQRKRIEWFEENPYTRNLNGARDIDFNECGCQDGGYRWVDRADRKEMWYLEVKNEAPSSTLCDVSLKPTAVDICQGHGTWRTNGDGCACDEGYSGQYVGPVENVATKKKNEIELNGDGAATAFLHLDSNDTPRTDKVHILKGIRKKLNNRGNNIPIEAAPGEVSGTLGTQDTHNLGCSVTAPVVDEFLKKRLEKSAKRAIVSMQRSPTMDSPSQIFDQKNPDVGGVYAYSRNRTKFFFDKRKVDKATTTSDSLYNDDCSGVMTANTLKLMTDTMVIACTGRTREELIQGLEGSTPATNKIANKKIIERDAFSTEEKHADGWGNLKDPRDTVGAKANLKYSKINEERAKDIKNRGPPMNSKAEEKIKNEEKQRLESRKANEGQSSKDNKPGVIISDKDGESDAIDHSVDDRNHEKEYPSENMFQKDDTTVKN
jgi:hypothetical protein